MQPSSARPQVNPLRLSARVYRAGPWVLLGLAVLAVGLWLGGRDRPHKPDAGPSAPSQKESPSADPRLGYTGRYRNIHPQVKYVGDSACVGCHKVETEGFHRHPMGRSIVPVAELSERYDRAVRNPFEALGSRFTVERQGGRVWHKQERLGPRGEILATFRTEAEYAIGSGERGHSYLTSRDGFWFQTPVSWYAQKQIWDLSPGFQSGRLRPVIEECLFCHSNGVRPVEHSLNRYETPTRGQLSIGCERCHGPGEAHVRARRADEPVKGRTDFTIVNPRRLPSDLRESICQQCHLEGVTRVLRRGRGLFDYRPGLPLRDFWTIYVATAELDSEQRAVSQVEQMYASKCFKASKGKLGCATCHDPHHPLPRPQRAAHYRDTCLGCHKQDHPCSLDLAVRLEKSKGDSCVECHMTRLGSDDIAHTASTDHRILRTPVPPSKHPPSRSQLKVPKIPLIPFHARAAADPEADRDLGMALVQAVRARGPAFVTYLPRAIELLTAASEKHPDDLDVLEHLGDALRMQGQKEKAFGVFKRLLTLSPNHVIAARSLSTLSMGLRRFHDALQYTEKALALNPWFPEGHLTHAMLLARDENYEAAATACRKLIEQDPTHAEIWVVLALCHRGMGKTEEALKDEQRAEALKTHPLDEFRAGFAAFLQ